jgi:cation transport regulator ChaC
LTGCYHRPAQGAKTTNEANTGVNWVFGYGSLIWRVDFPFVESRPAVTRDWSRRFWQGSTDHRGLPGAPGRVVTLVEERGAACWGMAYRLDPELSETVMADLDYREKGGYRRLDLDIIFQDTASPTGGARTSAVTWVAPPGNPNFLGEAGLDLIARQVAATTGPSGANSEYVLRLDEALRDAGAHDDHVFTLARMVRALA